jgi:alkylated DNA nucleotide flippase Atl1
MEQREFVPIIIEWVEEVLNGKVASTYDNGVNVRCKVEEVLNGKILSTVGNLPPSQVMVEKILGEVVSTQGTPGSFRMEVEEVLSVSTHDSQLVDFILGEKVLNSEAVSTRRQKLRQETQVEEILNAEGVSADSQIFIQEALCHNLISKMIETITPGSNSDYFRVEDVISHHNSSMTE